MPLEHKDRVSDTSNTTGTGTLTLVGAAPTGRRTFASAHTTGATIHYSIQSSDGTQWEVGEGVWTSSGSTLTRATVFASSNAGALVNFTGTPLTVISTMTAADAGSIAGIMDKVMLTKTTAQSSTTGTNYVNFDNVVYDTDGLYDSASGGVKPKRAGYYQVHMRYRQNTASFMAAVVSAGATTLNAGSDSQNVNGCGGSCVVYCNGSSDTIRGGAYVAAGGAITATGETYMQVLGPF